MKSRWAGFARFAIIIFMIILFVASVSLFTNIKRDVTYSSRNVGLSTLNDYFDAGEYEKIYESSIKNKYSDEKLYADVSQYEAFGRYFHAYMKAKMYEDNGEYLKEMAKEKENISWKKILDVIESLEKDL